MSITESPSQAEYKVVMLGDSGVGKTSLIDKFFLGVFENTVATTVDAAYIKKTIQLENQKVILSIWDTAGQERFQSLIPFYMRNARALVFVFDVTAQNSLQSLKLLYNSLNDQITPDMVGILCSNKIDLVDELHLDLTNFKEWANEHNMELVKTSAKTGQGVQELFKQVATLIIEKGELGSDRSNTLLRNIVNDDPNQQKNSSCC